MPKGTPKSLKQAVENALEQAHKAVDVGGASVAWHIRDFIAQKLCVAILRAKSDEERDRLRQLFEELTQGVD